MPNLDPDFEDLSFLDDDEDDWLSILGDPDDEDEFDLHDNAGESLTLDEVDGLIADLLDTLAQLKTVRSRLELTQ